MHVTRGTFSPHVAALHRQGSAQYLVDASTQADRPRIWLPRLRYIIDRIHSTRAVCRVSLLGYNRISPEVLYMSDPTMCLNYPI